MDDVSGRGAYREDRHRRPVDLLGIPPAAHSQESSSLAAVMSAGGANRRGRLQPRRACQGVLNERWIDV